ncbi:MAG: YbhN family protein [Acidimicrobiia bacterium]
MTDQHLLTGGDDAAEYGQSVPVRAHQPLWRRVLSVAITVAVLVVVFGFVLPKLADYDAVVGYLSDVSGIEWVVLGALALAFLAAYPVVLMQTMRSLRFPEALVNHLTGTAVTNAVPSGGAIALPLNYAMYMSWGFTPGIISAGMLGAGVWDWLARIALPVIAVFVVALTGNAVPWMWAVSIAGAVVVAAMVFGVARLLASDRAAEGMAGFTDRVGGWVFGVVRRDNPGIHDMVMRFRTDLKRIVDHRILRLSAATVANHAAMAALFTASIYAVGVSTDDITVAWVVLAFTLGRFLVMIPVSPGGLGLVDLGWIGILTLGWQATTGVPVDADRLAAGVLLFRALSFLPPIPIGMGTWLFWRSNRSWRQPWQVVRRGTSQDQPPG